MSIRYGDTNISRDISFFWYVAGAKRSEFTNAAWPSGLGVGYMPYNTGVVYMYEGNTGGWPSYLYGQNITNAYVLASHPGTGSIAAEGLVIVDHYGGVEPYLTGVHLPALHSGINAAFFNIPDIYPTFSGLFVIDIETYAPIWYPRNTGIPGTWEKGWQDYYNARYGYNEHASGVFLTSVKRMYEATIDELRSMMPNAKIAWYQFPITHIIQFNNPALFNETLASLQAKNDYNNSIFQKLDLLTCDVYNNMGKPQFNAPVTAGLGQISSSNFCTAFNTICSEFSRVALNNSKSWVGILNPFYPPGRPELTMQAVNQVDQDLICQIAIKNGASGLTFWCSIPDNGTLATGSIGIANINRVFYSISQRFKNMQNPLYVSNLWNSPW